MTFMIHSPPLRLGESLMTPTNASSEHTRRTGLCRVTREESSFSLCSGGRLDKLARDGLLRVDAKDGTSAAANEEGNRR